MPKEQKEDAQSKDQNNEPVESPKDDPELVVKEDVTTLAPAAAATDKKKFDLKAFLRTKKGKVVAILLAFALVVAVVFIVPASRYAVAGLVIKKDVTVELTDSETGKPVSAADVTLGSQTYKTDANGKATFTSVAVGNWSVASKKNYYQDGKADTLVPILSNPDTVKLRVVATGRQVPVSVTNRITGKALGGVEIIANDSTATTTENGEATIVLPADKQTVNATFKTSGYNDFTADITVTEQADDKNKFGMTSTGKVYFLSKRTGKVDVMSSNLDGSDQKTVLAGTGKETSGQALGLYASPDWKYLVLQAQRDNGVKLYIITTEDGKMSVLDEGAVFSPVGWTGDTFAYTVYRPTVKQWEAKQSSIKTYNAAAKKMTTVDDTEGAGTGPAMWLNQVYHNPYLMNGRIVYVKYWEDQGMTNELNSKKDQVVTVKPDGSDKKVLKDFPSPWTKMFESRKNKPNSFYLRVSFHTTPSEYYEYADDQLAPTAAVDANSFWNSSINYRFSPSGKQTAWDEYRDKNTLFVGDAAGANGKEVLKGDYYLIGWFGDDYLLLSKEGTMYVHPSTHTSAPQKITDFMDIHYVNTY